MIKYARLIQKLVRFAFNIKETTVDPNGRYTVKAFAKNKASGEMLQFGQLELDHRFVDFLDSGQYDKRVGGVDKIQEYLHGKSFYVPAIGDNADRLSILDENFNIIQNGGEEEVKELLNSHKNETTLQMGFKEKELGIPMHDAALENFNRWKKGDVRIVSPAEQLNK